MTRAPAQILENSHAQSMRNPCAIHAQFGAVRITKNKSKQQTHNYKNHKATKTTTKTSTSITRQTNKQTTRVNTAKTAKTQNKTTTQQNQQKLSSRRPFVL